MRKSMLIRSPTRKVRATDAFIENCDGPVIEFRGALPHSPAAGTANASALAYEPSLIGSGDTPVRLGRSDPRSEERRVGEECVARWHGGTVHDARVNMMYV